MANKRVIDLDPIVTLSDTDLTMTSLNGGGSRKETRAQTLTKIEDNININLANNVTGVLANVNTTATSSNTANTIVQRNAIGNFSAGTITANLTGNASTVTTNANLSGDVSSVGNSTTIQGGAVSYNKIQAVAASKLLGNPFASNLPVQEIPLHTSLDFELGELRVTPIPSPVDNNLVSMDSNGYVKDAGAAVTTSAVSNDNTHVMTSAAVQTAVATGVAAGVTSFNSRTGAVTPQSADYTVAQVTGAAPLASPTFTGTVTVPTPSNATDAATKSYIDTGLALKSNIASPTFTGNPAAPTQSQGDNSTKLATTSYVDTGLSPKADTATVNAALALKAPLASPALTGNPTAPTQSTGDNSTKLATTAYADTGLALKANIASPTFTGVPAAPTASPGTSTTQLATTAFVAASAASGVTSFNTRSGAVLPQTNDYDFGQLSGFGTVAQGCVGIASYTIGDIPYATAPNALSRRTAVAVGSVLASNGIGAPPIYSNAPAFGGNPTAPNITQGDNSTKLANTHYVDTAAAGVTLQKVYDNGTGVMLAVSGKPFVINAGFGNLMTVSVDNANVLARNLALGVYVQGALLTTDGNGNVTSSNAINVANYKSSFVSTTQTTISPPSLIPSNIGSWSTNVAPTPYVFNFTGSLTANIASSGLNGLDTGAVAANNWYALMLIYNTTTQTAGSLYTLNPATYSAPSGYAQARTVLWQRYTAAGFLKFIQVGNGVYKRTYYTDTAASTSVLSAGNSTVGASVSLGSFVTTPSRTGILEYTFTTAAAATFNIRETGSAVAFGSGLLSVSAGAGSTVRGRIEFICNSSQSIDYNVSSATASLSLSVLAYDNEL